MSNSQSIPNRPNSTPVTTLHPAVLLSTCVHIVEWRHNNLWSQYDLHVVGQHGIQQPCFGSYKHKNMQVLSLTY